MSTDKITNSQNVNLNADIYNKKDLKKSEQKTDEQKSIFDMADKNKEKKLVEQGYTKVKDLENGRKLVIDKNGKQHVMSHDGVILSDSYLEQQAQKENDKQKQAAKTTALSKEKNNSLNSIIKAHNAAQKAFDKQMKDDGWAGDVADGVSALWNSNNRATKVRKDLETSKNNIAQLKEAAKQGDAQFNAKFKDIYGIDYNQKAMDAYQKDPTEENYQKAFGTKQKNIKSRVDDYNQSQQTGAMAVKTTAKVGAGIAVGVATGGTGFVAMGAAAVGTAAASVAIEETDRLKVGDAVSKGKIEFREGTDHGQILKDAAFDGAAVLAGGAVAKGASAIVKGAKAATTAGQTAGALTKGQKAAKAGLTVTGDVATGAAQEKLQTGQATLEGTLMNAAMSGAGSAAETGLLKEGYQAVKKGLGKAADKVSDGIEQVKPAATGNAKTATQDVSVKSEHNPVNTPEDPDADLDRFLHMGDLVARGTNNPETGKQGFFSKLFGKKQAAEPTSVTPNNTNAKRSVVTKLDSNVDLNNISASGIKDGGMFTQNGQLYIRNGNEATKLNISQNTYERLFPHEQLQFNQTAGANSCWFLSSVDASFDSPNGKASILKMFSEDVNGNVHVKLNNTNKTIVFPGGKPMKGIEHGVKGNDGVAMLEQSMAAKYDMNANREYVSYSGNEVNINSFSPEDLDRQICTKRTAKDAISLLGGRLDSSKIADSAVDKEKFKNNLKAAAKDPNSFPSIASYAHQRVVKDVKTIGGTDYAYISDPYNAGNYERVELDELIRKESPKLAVYSFPSKAAAQPKNAGSTGTSAAHGTAQPNQPETTAVKSNVQAQQTSQTTTSNTSQQKPRYTAEEQTYQANNSQASKTASGHAPVSSAQPQKARISSTNMKEIGTVNGQPVMARYVERVGNNYTVEVNGKQYQIAPGQTLNVSDNISLKCGTYGVTSEVNPNAASQRTANSYTASARTASQNIAQPQKTVPKTSQNLALPSGYREYGKIMGRRAIINSDNIVMYEVNGTWKRAN